MLPSRLDLQFSVYIGKSISLIVSQRNICYLFNNCEKRILGICDFTCPIVSALRNLWTRDCAAPEKMEKDSMKKKEVAFEISRRVSSFFSDQLSNR